MIRKFFLLILAFLLFVSFRSDKPAYILYNKTGKQVKFKRLIESAKKADVVFFGELHNNPISHWLQVELTTELHNAFGANLVMGAEMFEADNQEGLDQFLSSEIDKETFKKSVRLWPNYKTDIEPLVEFAKDHQLRFVATNIPRRYASMVYRNGIESLDTLPDHVKAWIAPLPMPYDPELPGYKNMLTMMGGTPGHTSENFPKAQAIKDATMAWFIDQNLKSGQKFIHFNGTYHSDNFEGIIWYLRRLRPELSIMTIATIEAGDISKLPDEKKGVADFILAVPENMTKTH